MLKNIEKKIITGIMIGMLILLNVGCTLADADSKNIDKEGSLMVVGVLITEKPLEAEKIYAKKEQTGEKQEIQYIFENVKGYKYFSYEGDEIAEAECDIDFFSNVNIKSFQNMSNDEKALDIDFMVNTDYIEGEWQPIYVNPIYEDIDGKIYVKKCEEGWNLHNGVNELQSFSFDEVATMNNDTKLKTRVELNVLVAQAYDDIKLLQYDADNKVIKDTSLDLEADMEDFKLENDTQYVMAISYKNGNVQEAQVANVSSEDDEEWDHIDMNIGSDAELAIKHTSIYFTK